MENNLYYNTPLDISVFFSGKNMSHKLILFVYKEAIEQIKEARENEINIFCPITLENTSHSHQTDYRFLVHCVAKFVSIELNDKSKYFQVLNHFEIKNSKNDGPLSAKNRILLMFLFDMVGFIYVPKRMLNKRNYSYYFIQKLIEYNGELFEFKTVTLNKWYIAKYVDGFEDFYEDHIEYFEEDNIEQVAFGSAAVNKKINENKDFKSYFYSKRIDTSEYLNISDCYM